MALMRNASLVFILSTAFLFFTLSIVFNNPYRPHRDHLQPRKPVQDCTTDLAADLYGLGVRLGVYFQWFSGWVANNFIVDEISGGLDANAIFLFALLVSLIFSTTTNDMTLMDGLIMVMLCAGTVWGVLSLWGYRTCVYRRVEAGEDPHDGIKRFGGFGTHLRLLLGGAVCCYALWFWTVGTKGLPEGLSDFGDVDVTCKRTTVLVYDLPIAGTAGTAVLILTSIMTAHYAVATLVAPIAGITRLLKVWLYIKDKKWASSTRLRFATGASSRVLKITSWTLCGVNLAWILFIMLTIELALNQNCIEAVIGADISQNNGHILQPSQLIPMLIGAFSFIRILFMTFELWRSPDGDITPSLGRAKSRRNRQSSHNATSGMNIFRLFSSGNSSMDEIKYHQESPKVQNEHQDIYYDLYKRLGFWQRAMITWLPWLSLFYFWPWTKDFERFDSAGEDAIPFKSAYRYEPASISPRKKSGTVTWADEMHDEPTDMSELDTYQPHHPKNAV